MRGLFAILATCALTLSCSPEKETIVGSVEERDTKCAANTAQILLGNGYFRLLCGCREGDGIYSYAHQFGSCTVAGTHQVTAHVQDTSTPHQLQVTGPDGAQISAAPGDLLTFTASTEGLYRLADIFHAELGIRVVVAK